MSLPVGMEDSLRLPDGLELPGFSYGIGNSDELHIGHFIYVVGNPMNMGFNVREGIVSNLRASERINLIRYGQDPPLHRTRSRGRTAPP